jgi:hypothetical protein
VILERARLFACEEVGESKDLYLIEILRELVLGTYHRMERFAAVERNYEVGVLRLRGCFASRSSHSSGGQG